MRDAFCLIEGIYAQRVTFEHRAPRKYRYALRCNRVRPPVRMSLKRAYFFLWRLDRWAEGNSTHFLRSDFSFEDVHRFVHMYIYKYILYVRFATKFFRKSIFNFKRQKTRKNYDFSFRKSVVQRLYLSWTNQICTLKKCFLTNLKRACFQDLTRIHGEYVQFSSAHWWKRMKNAHLQQPHLMWICECDNVLTRGSYLKCSITGSVPAR